MAHFLHLYSPATYRAFFSCDRTVTGFQIRHKVAAEKVKSGDKFLCYVTRLSRWFGVLDVVDRPFLAR